MEGQIHLYPCACGDTLTMRHRQMLDCCWAKGMDDLRPKDWSGAYVDRSLVDDLADVLVKTCVGWEPIIGHDLSQAPEVKRVLARYHREMGDDG